MGKESTYFLGCPVWACESWKGKVFPHSAKRSEWLNRYSRIFKTVEGNTSFYALPEIETVQRWAEDTAEGFRFCLKFPKVISHERRLVGCRQELDRFLERLMVLFDANRLGPSFLQLPPDFGSKELKNLQLFLNDLPRELAFAVEVRHDDFFAGCLETEFNGLLKELEMDRVILDSRALFHFPPADMSESRARRRKPRVAIGKWSIGQFPFLRLIGINRVEKLGPWIDEWAAQVAKWIQENKTPFVFTHTPDDQFAPEFAEKFHLQVQKHLPSLQDWKIDRFSTETQLELFS